MGSATRSALGSARSALAGAQGIDLAAGEQLLLAARTIGSSPQLVSALTDSSATREAKAELIGSIFGGLSTSARALLEGMVADRWASGDGPLARLPARHFLHLLPAELRALGNRAADHRQRQQDRQRQHHHHQHLQSESHRPLPVWTGRQPQRRR